MACMISPLSWFHNYWSSKDILTRTCLDGVCFNEAMIILSHFSFKFVRSASAVLTDCLFREYWIRTYLLPHIFPWVLPLQTCLLSASFVLSAAILPSQDWSTHSYIDLWDIVKAKKGWEKSRDSPWINHWELTVQGTRS